MGNPDNDPERRASVRRASNRISLQQDGHMVREGFVAPEILDDDDDYMMAMAGMISDGFRPEPLAPSPDLSTTPTISTSATGDSPSTSYNATTSHQLTSVSDDDEPVSPVSPLSESRPQSAQSMQYANPRRVSAESSTMPQPDRSSISKPPRGRDSLTLRHDGAEGHMMAGACLSRVSSNSSDAAYIPVDGPYQGPSAPSHPYQMYSQGLARTMSVATTSTSPNARPESEYDGPRGPSHPYSMYPQNPIEEAPRPVVPAIPVGFVNADPYQRRLGPDGEELAGIIGPDGHTEELPPYTRYPDEFYSRKIRDNEESQRGEGASASTPAAAVGSAPGAVGVAVTTMAAIPTTAAAAPAQTTSIPGAGGLGLAARNPEFDSRSLEDGSPQSRHSSRTFASNASHHEVNMAAAGMSEKPQLSKYQRFAKKKACGIIPYWALGLTFTAMVIVIIIVAAVVGSLLSHHKPPKKSSSTTNYQDSMPTVTVTFDATPIATPTDLPALAQGTYGLPLNLNQAPNTCFTDTSQTSAWSCNIAFPQAIGMQMSITRNAPQLGKDGTYDVYMTSNSSGNDQAADEGGSSLSYGAAAPLIEPAMNMELVNDTFDLDRGPAWFRMLQYNKTVVVQEDLLTTSSSSKKGKRVIPTVANFQRKGVASAGEKPWICTWPDTLVEMFIYAEQNSSYASESTATITTVPVTQTGTATASGATGTATGNTEVISMSHLTAYPRAVKVKERRLQKSSQAFCVQVEIQDNNSTTPVLDSDGNQVKVWIGEDESADSNDKRDLRKRSNQEGNMSNCGCMWFSS